MNDRLNQEEIRTAENRLPPEPAVKPKKNEKRPFQVELYTMLHDLVNILAVVTIFFTFIVRLVGVSGPSMTPTLIDGDYVLVQSNFNYRSVKTGDIVVMLVRTYDDQPIVKRVIAMEGQTVDIDFGEGKVYVDGQLLDEPYINNYLLDRYNTNKNYMDGLSYPVTVPAGCLFVLGDNRDQSADSRYAPIGLVDKRCVVGKARVTVFPLRRIGLVH